MINVTIDNKQIQVAEGTTILKAARQAGIHIPTLCYFELAGMNFENKPGGCRVWPDGQPVPAHPPLSWHHGTGAWRDAASLRPLVLHSWISSSHFCT